MITRTNSNVRKMVRVAKTKVSIRMVLEYKNSICLPHLIIDIVVFFTFYFIFSITPDTNIILYLACSLLWQIISLV